MNWVASILNGTTAYTIDADKKYATRLMVTEEGHLSHVGVLLDGLGGGAGSQVAKVAIYDGTGALVATSDEVTVVSGQPQEWVPFTFERTVGGLDVMPGPFDVAVHGGPITDVIRVFGHDPVGAGGMWNADTYADGPAATFGSATALTRAFDLFLAYFKPYASVLPRTDDIYYSRLPFVDAQAALAGGIDETTQQLVNVGWHGTFLDPEQGSNALVRDGSAEADAWLGQRLKVTAIGLPKERSAYVYVHNLGPSDMNWDLSLTRKVMSRIGVLSADTVQCVVEVVS